MRIYACPDDCAFAEPNYTNYDSGAEQKRQDEHSAKLKAWLIEQGFTGKNTGEIFSEPHADGYANYMVAEGFRAFSLIHLPYGDAWDSRNVKFLTKAEILKRIKARKDWATIPPMQLPTS